jgi:16S rRNA (cytosine967-C5)-methyltransferase
VSDATPARRVAYEVLRRVFEHGAWADRSLRSAADRAGLEARDRAHAQRLAYGAVQRRGTSDHVIAELSGRPPGRIDRPLVAALRLGLYELLFEPGAGRHAVVDQAVELAKGDRPGGRRRRGAALVNAVLRRAARERDRIVAAFEDSDPAGAAIAHSLPPWIAEMWWRELGAERARSLMAAANVPAERAVRMVGDPSGSGAGVLLDELRAAGVGLSEPPGSGLLAPPGVLVVTGGPWAPVEKAIAAGRLIPQSRASAAVSEVLGLTHGERVLDLCAAPGVKTLQLAAGVGSRGSVVAVEAHPGRARELGELAARAGIGNIEVRTGDARTVELGGHYDRVLVDAPCTGLGTLASRPDLRWRREPADVEEMAALGGELLGRAVGATRPGGRIVMSLCTISRREGTGVAGALGEADGRVEIENLGAREPALADGSDPRFLQTLPDRDGTDGFFIAAMGRRG